MSNQLSAHKPHHDSPEPKPDWEKHLRWLTPVTAVILIAATVFMWTQGRQTNLRSEVLSAYTLANTAQELQTVADAYPDETEAPLARLQAGAMYYNEGDFEAALAQYELFLKAYATHPMHENAQWGKWMSQEALGSLDEAMAGFQSITEDSLVYPQALLGQARIFEKKGQNEEALGLYTRIQEMNPQSSWAEQARVFADQVKLK